MSVPMTDLGWNDHEARKRWDEDRAKEKARKSDTLDPVVSFNDWESGRVKLSNERFDPILGDVIGYSWQNDMLYEHRRVLGYRGSVTGTRLGTWFAEVMEPAANAEMTGR